jgi:hypothetical protein
MAKMKFTVRHGFMCFHQVPQLDEKGEVVGVLTNTFPGGSTVEFTEEEASQHKHKLEAVPGDKVAAKFLEPAPIVQAQHDSGEVGELRAMIEAQQKQIAELLAATKK